MTAATAMVDALVVALSGRRCDAIFTDEGSCKIREIVKTRIRCNFGNLLFIF